MERNNFTMSQFNFTSTRPRGHDVGGSMAALPSSRRWFFFLPLVVFLEGKWVDPRPLASRRQAVVPGPATIYTTGGPTGLSQIKYCSCGRLTIPDKGNNPSRVPIQTGSLTIPVRPTKLDTQTGSTNANPSSKQSNDPVRHNKTNNKTTTKLTHRGPL